MYSMKGMKWIYIKVMYNIIFNKGLGKARLYFTIKYMFDLSRLLIWHILRANQYQRYPEAWYCILQYV